MPRGQPSTWFQLATFGLTTLQSISTANFDRQNACSAESCSQPDARLGNGKLPDTSAAEPRISNCDPNRESLHRESELSQKKWDAAVKAASP